MSTKTEHIINGVKFTPTTKIEFTDNPKQPHSKAHARYAIYQKAKTWGEYLKLNQGGYAMIDARHDFGKGFLRVLSPAIAAQTKLNSATNNKTTSHKKSQRTGASSAKSGLMKSGLYLVTLNNEEPISVNANDPRVADKAIKVTKANCKFGKTKNLAVREKGYFKHFGEDNANFKPLVQLEEIDIAEKAVLKCLDNYRIRGRTGRKNEWLENINPETVEAIVFSTLKKTGIKYEKI